MFSLIVTIIAIALVTALSIATIYYGAKSYSEAHEAAQAAKSLQEANQINGAFELYKVDHDQDLPTGTEQNIKDTMVSTNYLKAWPATTPGGATWTLINDFAVLTGISQTQCESLNAKIGVTGTPLCTDPAFQGKTVCCMTP